MLYDYITYIILLWILFRPRWRRRWASRRGASRASPGASRRTGKRGRGYRWLRYRCLELLDRELLVLFQWEDKLEKLELRNSSSRGEPRSLHGSIGTFASWPKPCSLPLCCTSRQNKTNKQKLMVSLRNKHTLNNKHIKTINYNCAAPRSLFVGV